MSLQLYKEFISIYVIFTGLIIGVISWRRLLISRWIYFPIFLITIGVLDRIGIYLYATNQKELSQKFYLFFIIPLEFIFYFILYYLAFHKNKLWLTVSILTYVISIFLEPILKETISGFYFTSFSFLVGILVLLINILAYFFDLSKSDKILNFYREKLFWISTGLLIFWIGSLPYYGLFNYINRNYYQLLLNYTWLIMTLNYIMYTFFIAAFVWGKEN